MWFKEKNGNLASSKEELMKACIHGEDSKVDKIINNIISTYADDKQKMEELTGWAIFTARQHNIASSARYVLWFKDKFPESFMPVRIEYAAHLLDNSRHDESTCVCRQYLRDLKDNGYFKKFGGNILISDGAAKAFLLMTIAYIKVSARSYARRILEKGLQYPFDLDWKTRLVDKIVQIEEGLKEHQNSNFNNHWEEFYQTGSGAETLIEICHQRDCPRMARRVKLIEENFKLVPDYNPGKEEMFQVEHASHNIDGTETYILI